MNILPQTQKEQSDLAPAYIPASPGAIVRGRQDFFSVLLRLTGMELYKIRCRTMSKVLAIISILSMLLFSLVVLLVTLVIIQKDGQINPSPLLPPLSLYLASQVVLTLGEVLIIILIGTLVGGEYGVGTIRLLLTRGPTRVQFLLAKAVAALVCCALGTVVMIALGVLLGLVFNLTTGTPFNFDFFTAAWSGHAMLYMLIIIFSLFIYSMLALFLATFGRSTAAGIAGALTWLLLGETILRTILDVIGTATGGATGDFLRAVPNYFIGSNTSALLQNQYQYLGFFGNSSFSSASSISDLQAILVLIVYVAAFIGLSLWLNQKRDITN
jgi:ABC-type transport system involved in multi-copper enzyme maturation permease subunit